MPDRDLFVGIDLGTSGARAIVIDGDGRVHGTAKAAMSDFGSNHRAPAIWWQAAEAALGGALEGVERARVRAVAVDGTSGTMVPVDPRGVPLSDGLMYNDACPDNAVLEAIARHAPASSAAHGPTSGLARAILFQRLRPAAILHQADWIAFNLSGRFVSDANNALKTGYDPVSAEWPRWIAETGLDISLLPPVSEPGMPAGPITADAAAAFGLPSDTLLMAGTTDGCASFLATGASEAGDGVSALGTTLTIKILSDKPIFAPEYGIYSHRILGKWLAGGASNSGGAALLAHFTAEEMTALTPEIDPETDTGLDYYPLPKPGERFPVADPLLAPRTDPRPESRAEFLKALFEGVAGVEALAFRRLAELGAPPLRSVRSVGGGAQNPVWTRIRERRLGVRMEAPQSSEAAFGAALLAKAGAGA
ncbi:FGGY-family carbohydrate kinase [Albidovulum sediminicola]|uniref:FGGY-family carbohydrate kinase n=1 Tax=Albidovulum sediminicola TaxID=2984331 RepID=A0ABT2Z1U2_9RHOB|nr:FGGY-family carbohydrate kinase [Defluviimonas sp. WL0075]MCV2865091.1 FGGY-family carbohydrate kinase [Defluviimonas sp. WL0075]